MKDGTGQPLKRLNDGTLKPGDIVLTTSTAAVSKAVRFATRSDISHAMILVEDHSVVDATAEGVHARNTQRLMFEDECSIHVLRLREGLSDTQLATLVTFMRGHIGTQYSVREAVLTAIGGARQPSKKQFCSRIVAQAFASAGIYLVPDPNFCSPADLKDSPLLVAIADTTLPVTVEQAALWEGTLDVPQMMRDATNAFLDGARLKSGAIQTFDDVHRHLVAHPEDDDGFCRLLETSGYLSIWKIDRDLNPWQYDFELMREAPTDEIEEYCWYTVGAEDAGPNRYVANRGAYTYFAEQYGLRFFRVMADLYDLLASLHQRRVDVAIEWLRSNGHLIASTKSHLTPHSPEWFNALQQWDPAKAIMTRRVVELAGRTDICSIWGMSRGMLKRKERRCSP